MPVAVPRHQPHPVAKCSDPACHSDFPFFTRDNSQVQDTPEYLSSFPVISGTPRTRLSLGVVGRLIQRRRSRDLKTSQAMQSHFNASSSSPYGPLFSLNSIVLQDANNHVKPGMIADDASRKFQTSSVFQIDDTCKPASIFCRGFKSDDDCFTPLEICYDTKPDEGVSLPNISYVLNGPNFPHGRGGYTSETSSLALPITPDRSGSGTYWLPSDREGGCSSAMYSTEPSVYATICEPVSNWIATYIWKVATQGMSLPSSFVPLSPTAMFPPDPLPVLAESISSLLLSTLIQPASIILSLQYISRLPAYLGPCSLDVDSGSSTLQFKAVLSSVDATHHESPVTRALYSSFKLFVVGIILSNKVLDDHVFTLKTWNEISGIPLPVLNKLEWLSLRILSHQLYLDPVTWWEWVSTLQQYHRSLAIPGNIGEPESTNGVFRDILDSLEDAYAPAIRPGLLVNPIFLGMQDRIRKKEREREELDETEYYHLELDENGPLREEYIPRRRPVERLATGNMPKELPPPSRWSPGMADSPIGISNRPLFHLTTESSASSSWPPTPSPLPFIQTCRASCDDALAAIRGNYHFFKDSVPWGLEAVVSPDVLPYVQDRSNPSTTLCDYFLSCSRTQARLHSIY